ncbi:MAG: RluA family pseudouridine synthase [bacterium]|nr:RluA family pseudouridine synthase [bacterium]
MPERTIENDFRCEIHEDRQRLDLILARRYPRFNRGDWQERIRKGDVLINDAPARPSRKVATGDLVRFRFQRGPEPDVSRDYRFIYEDEFLYVIDKPGDLPVHPSGVYNENTLYSLIKAERGADYPVNLVHRLDRETSGLMVVAKDGDTARILQNAFQAKDEIRKIYQTIVECPDAGFPEFLDARGWIFAAGQGPVRKKRSFAREEPDRNALHSFARDEEGPQVQSARTEFRRLGERRAGESAVIALVEARLFTGRMHQIRATLCSLGYPVVGDRLYGVDENLYLKMIRDEESDADRARLRIQRTALHAIRLEFRHPRTGKDQSFASELPGDMRGLFFEDQ